MNSPERRHDAKVTVASGLVLDRLYDEKKPRGKYSLGNRTFVTKYMVTHGKILRGWKCTETVDVPMYELFTAMDAML